VIHARGFRCSVPEGVPPWGYSRMHERIPSTADEQCGSHSKRPNSFGVALLSRDLLPLRLLMRNSQCRVIDRATCSRNREATQVLCMQKCCTPGQHHRSCLRDVALHIVVDVQAGVRCANSSANPPVVQYDTVRTQRRYNRTWSVFVQFEFPLRSATEILVEGAIPRLERPTVSRRAAYT
jgi:hypothetical protein